MTIFPPLIHRTLTRKERKDLKILALFTSVYCRDHHSQERLPLSDLPRSLTVLQRFPCCVQCRDFLLYAIERRLRCPLDDKPSCRHCPVHCYRPDQRELVRTIMRYSGKALIKKGRLDLLLHYLF